MWSVSRFGTLEQRGHQECSRSLWLIRNGPRLGIPRPACVFPTSAKQGIPYVLSLSKIIFWSEFSGYKNQNALQTGCSTSFANSDGTVILVRASLSLSCFNT